MSRGAIESLEARALLATLTWAGTNYSANNWSTAANWSPARAPQTGDDLVFSSPSIGYVATTTNDDMDGLSINSISFANSTYWSLTGFTKTGTPTNPGKAALIIAATNKGISVSPGFGSTDANPTIVMFDPGSLTLNGTTNITLPVGTELDLLENTHSLAGTGAFVTANGKSSGSAGGNLVYQTQQANSYLATPTIATGKITIGTSTTLPKGTKLTNGASFALGKTGPVGISFLGTKDSPSVFTASGDIESNFPGCTFIADTIDGYGTFYFDEGNDSALGTKDLPVGTVVNGQFYLGASDDFINTIQSGAFYLNSSSNVPTTLTVNDPGSANIYIYNGGSFTVNNAIDESYKGRLSSSGEFHKQGLGNLTLTDPSSGYSGDVDVDAGTLTLGAKNTFPLADAVNVAAGATLDLNGTGIFKPNGSVVLKATSTFVAHLGATTGDQLATPGVSVDMPRYLSIGISGATLKLVPSAIPAVGTKFTLIQSGSFGISGTFAGLPNNAIFSAGGVPFQISYTTSQVVVSRVAVTATESVSSSIPQSTYGQSVVFTAGLTPSTGAPTATGSVQFQVDGTNLGSAVTLVNGSAKSPATTGISAGSHTIKAIYSGDSLYSSLTATTSQAVAKASLTVTADPQGVGHGDPIPALTATLSGLVNGDTTDAFTGSPSLSTTANAASPVGTYPITVGVGTLSATNYSFTTFVNGTLTVQPKVLDVRVSYGNASMSILGLTRDLPFLNITAVDLIFSDKVNATLGSLALTGQGAKAYAFNAFSYDSTKNDAKWTLTTALGLDKLTASINALVGTTSGSGIIRLHTPTSFGFSVLPGDIDGDGVVTILDSVTALNDTAPGVVLSTWADLEGNGVLTVADYLTVRKKVGTHL